MASPSGHTYPSPEEAEMNEGTSYPYPIAPQQQQQQAPQAVMKSGQQQQLHQQSRHPSQVSEIYIPREIAPHPSPFNNQGNPEYSIPQIQQQNLQPAQQLNPFDVSGSPLMKKAKAGRACDQCRVKKVSFSALQGFILSPMLFIVSRCVNFFQPVIAQSERQSK